MPESAARPLNIRLPRHLLKVATLFANANARLQCHLITKEKMLEEDWPRDSLDDLMPAQRCRSATDDRSYAFIGRKLKVDRVVALEEFDVMTGGLIREHFACCMRARRQRRSESRMAEAARAGGILLPEFVPRLMRMSARLHGTRAAALDH